MVGPLLQQGAVEAFDFAVGLRAPGPGEAGADAQLVAGVAPGVLGVGPGVVGQDPLDGDAASCEPGGCSSQEGRAGGGPLVRQVLGVGQAGVVVQGGVQVGVSGAGAVLAAGCPAEGFVSAAIGDAAEFLDVDVDQFAGPGAFVAADGFAGGPVDGCECGQAVPGEDAVGGGGSDAASGSQPDGADVVLAPELDDLPFHRGRGLPWAVARAAGAVVHARGPVRAVAA